MFPVYTGGFGNKSDFMNHVHNRWCDHIDSVMDLATGYGFPNLFADPYAPGLLEDGDISVTYSDEVVLGQPLDIEYKVNNVYCKSKFTSECSLDKIATTPDGKIYPLQVGVLETSIYSNSSRKSPTNYAENFYKNDITVNVVDSVVNEVPGALDLMDDGKLVDEYIPETDVVRCSDTITADEFTIQFAVDFSKNLINIPLDNGVYTTKKDLLYFYNGVDDNKSLGHLFLQNIAYATGNDYITLTNSSRIKHAYYDPLTEHINTHTIGNGLGSVLNITSVPYGIFTMVKSSDGIEYLFNGTRIGKIKNLPKLNILLNEVYVDKHVLCHDNSRCVRMYDRALTNDEVIQNTIFMLHSHFERVE